METTITADALTTVRIASRAVPSRRAFWPSTYEAKLVTEDGRELGTSRGDTREQAIERARKMATRRGLQVDAGRCSWSHLDGWPEPADAIEIADAKKVLK